MSEIVYGTPEAAKKTGLYNEKVVYTERIPKYKREVARDADGKILWHTKGDLKVKEKLRLVPAGYEEREYVEDKLRNNVTQKLYGFREDPEIVAAKQAEEAAQKDLQDAAVLARKHGTSLTELFAKLFEKGDEPAEDNEPEEAKMPNKRPRSRKSAA